MAVSVEVLEERVNGVAADVAQLRRDNDSDHQEFKKKIDRLPNWAVFAISALSSLATLGMTLVVKH